MCWSILISNHICWKWMLHPVLELTALWTTKLRRMWWLMLLNCSISAIRKGSSKLRKYRTRCRRGSWRVKFRRCQLRSEKSRGRRSWRKGLSTRAHGWRAMNWFTPQVIKPKIRCMKSWSKKQMGFGTSSRQVKNSINKDWTTKRPSRLKLLASRKKWRLHLCLQKRSGWTPCKRQRRSSRLWTIIIKTLHDSQWTNQP